MRKTVKIFAAAAVLSALMTVTAFAGNWVAGGADKSQRWYDLGKGKFAVGWTEIDSNADGICEYYYFDENGWLLMDTTTPDGKTVNKYGEWVVDGVVQTTKMAEEAVITGAEATDAEGNALPFITAMPQGKYKLSYYTYNNGQYVGTPANGYIYVMIKSASEKEIMLEFERIYPDGSGYSYESTFTKQSDGTYVCVGDRAEERDQLAWSISDNFLRIYGSDFVYTYDYQVPENQAQGEQQAQ